MKAYVDINILADFVEVADLRGQNVIDMLSSGWKDYEDATQYRSAIDEQVDCIITRNEKDYNLSKIPVYNPTQFLALMGEH